MNGRSEAVELALEMDDDNLIRDLAIHTLAIEQNPSFAGSYSPEVTIEVDHLGVEDDLVELGTRILRNIARELHSLCCGARAEDKKDRNAILQSIGAGDVVLGSAITSVLITVFAVSPAVAPLVAALVVKRILKPAGSEICKVWGEKLDAL